MDLNLWDVFTQPQDPSPHIQQSPYFKGIVMLKSGLFYFRSIEKMVLLTVKEIRTCSASCGMYN